ncbi:unnamed protein product [Haemonchus placei]|uniref:ANK_REP_REGION domain-containing protein n=1 Tax=Haemonchus placei TaxID=6290 RepID=A0A158QRS5_HAEPC|nr:unnamed protein product [Haemonchus placei]
MLNSTAKFEAPQRSDSINMNKAGDSCDTAPRRLRVAVPRRISVKQGKTKSTTRQMFVPNVPATKDLADNRSGNSEEPLNLICESESNAESESSSEEEMHPGLIDFEEMSKGMDKATARIRKHLHDDTHIYSPTEQFLYKAMESDQGRMTRSRTKAMMDATPLTATYTPKQPRRSPRKTKKAFYSDEDPDDRALAEFLEQWRAESCSKSPDKMYVQAEEPSVFECTCKRRRGRPRKISFSNASCSKEPKVIAENDLGLGVHLECEPQVACIVAPPLQDHDDDIVVLFDSCGNSGTPVPEYMPHSVDVSHSSCDTESASVCIPSTDDPHTPSTSYSSKRKRINKDRVGSSKLQKRRTTRRTKSVELVADNPMEKSDSTSSLAEEKAIANTDATASSSNKQDNLRPEKPHNTTDSQSEGCKQSKRSPPSECVSASSSVVDIVELTLSKQQEIENAYSSSRSKPQRVINTRRYITNKETAEKASNTSPPAESVKPMDVQQMLNSKLKARRSMAAHLPGPITYSPFQEIRDEMYEDAVALYAPERPSFDPEICRNIICTKTHESDDLITVLAKWAPELLRVQDAFLKIPLHIAVEGGEVCRVSTLLQLGSPVCWKDKNGLSPLEIAYSFGNGSVLKLLLNSGATFHELLASEQRLPPLRRGHLFKMLARHSGIISGIMRSARKRILRNIFEIASLSPVFIAPFKDGADPIFRVVECFSFFFVERKYLDRNSPTMLEEAGSVSVGSMIDSCTSKAYSSDKENIPSMQSANSESEATNHGVSDTELMRSGTEKAADRTLKQLQYENHIYSPTEQFLYKVMELDTGRMTRSRTKVLMESTPPRPMATKKQLCRKSGILKKSLSADERILGYAEILKGSQNGTCQDDGEKYLTENRLTPESCSCSEPTEEISHVGTVFPSISSFQYFIATPKGIEKYYRYKQKTHSSTLSHHRYYYDEDVGVETIINRSLVDILQVDGTKRMGVKKRLRKTAQRWIFLSWQRKLKKVFVPIYLLTALFLSKLPGATGSGELSTEVPSGSIDTKSAKICNMMDPACENIGRKDEEMPLENVFSHSSTVSPGLSSSELLAQTSPLVSVKVPPSQFVRETGSSFDHGISASSAGNYLDTLANTAHIHNDLQSQHYILSECSPTLEESDAFLSVNSATGVVFSNNQYMECIGCVSPLSRPKKES